MSSFDDDPDPRPDSRHDAIRRGRVARAAYWTALGDGDRAAAEPSAASLSAWREAAAAARKALEPEPCPARLKVYVEGKTERIFECDLPRGEHGDLHRASGSTDRHIWHESVDW